AARDSFATCYRVNHAGSIKPPGSLTDPEMGLTLAVHMAALVAVDAYVSKRRPPTDMAGLTGYLLDREHLHWTNLFGDGTHDLDASGNSFRTPPEVMHQMVFTAALTGPVDHATAKAILDRLGLPVDPAQVLIDHAVCYPPADRTRGTVLEPLYPDRL